MIKTLRVLLLTISIRTGVIAYQHKITLIETAFNMDLLCYYNEMDFFGLQMLCSYEACKQACINTTVKHKPTDKHTKKEQTSTSLWSSFRKVRVAARIAARKAARIAEPPSNFKIP